MERSTQKTKNKRGVMAKEIAEILEKYKNGLSVSEITKLMPTSRHNQSVQKRLEIMTREKIVSFEKVTKETPKKLCSTGQKTKQKTTLFFLTKTAST